MLNNSIKTKLKNDEIVFGTFFKIYSPAMMEIIGRLGFDFTIIDTEHNFLSYAEVENLVRAADSVGMCTVIRTQDDSESTILHSLDTGAGGIQVPSLHTVEEVKGVIEKSKYFPAGMRGWGNGTRAGDYALTSAKEYLAYSNENSMLVIHIENVEMVEQIEELCQLPYIDVFFVGPGDLSQSMGKPGQINDPEVVANVEKVITTARKYGKSVGTYIAGEASMERYIKLGARYIVWKSDMAIYVEALKSAVQKFAQFR